MYEKCTFDVVPNSETAERAILKQSTLHHFLQDLEYYHTTELTEQQQVEVSMKMLFDPSLKSKWKDFRSKVPLSDELTKLIKKLEE